MVLVTSHTSNGRNPAPLEIYRTLQIMVNSPYQQVSRISEPSTVAFIRFPSFLSIPIPSQQIGLRSWGVAFTWWGSPWTVDYLWGCLKVVSTQTRSFFVAQKSHPFMAHWAIFVLKLISWLGVKVFSPSMLWLRKRKESPNLIYPP